MKRLLSTLIWALVLLVLVAAPAVADGDVEVIVRQAPAVGSTLRGETQITVEARADSSLQTFRVMISPIDDWIPVLGADARVSKSYPIGSTQAATIYKQWDSQVITPYNGRYSINVRATSHLGYADSKAISPVVVDNAPLQVGGLEANLDENDVPRLTWNSNREPDVLHYLVQRSVGTIEFRDVAYVQTPENSYSDVDAPGGVRLRYRVTAFRFSSVGPDGRIASGVSEPVEIRVPSTGPPDVPAEISAISEPLAPPEVSRPPVQKPALAIRYRGFDASLPYAGNLPASAISGPRIEPADRAEPLRTAVASAQSDKPTHFAAALLMLIAAAHVLRFARRLYSST